MGGDVNVPRHGDGISLREMAPLADALEKFATGSELKSEVVCCLGLEPFVEFDLRGKTNTSGDKWRRGRAMGRGTGGGGAAGGNRTHDVGMMEPLEDLHFALHPLLVPLDLLLRNGLERDIAHDVGRLGGVIMRGCVGGGRGDREDGCGRGGCK